MDLLSSDPIELQNLIKCHVEIKTNDGNFHKGKIFTIDPVTKSVILTIKVNNKVEFDIIVGSSIKSLQVCSKDAEDDLELYPTTNLSEELSFRKQNLKEWLLKNHIPVTEKGLDLKIDNSCYILPPYTKDDCVSDNIIVKENIQKLISSLKLPQV